VYPKLPLLNILLVKTLLFKSQLKAVKLAQSQSNQSLFFHPYKDKSMQDSIRFPEVSKSTYDFVTENENKNTTLKTVGHEKLLQKILRRD